MHKGFSIAVRIWGYQIQNLRISDLACFAFEVHNASELRVMVALKNIVSVIYQTITELVMFR